MQRPQDTEDNERCFSGPSSTRRSHAQQSSRSYDALTPLLRFVGDLLDKLYNKSATSSNSAIHDLSLNHVINDVITLCQNYLIYFTIACEQCTQNFGNLPTLWVFISYSILNSWAYKFSKVVADKIVQTNAPSRSSFLSIKSTIL